MDKANEQKRTFWWKCAIEGYGDAAILIRAFFENFNPESSIAISGKEVVSKIVFDQPPSEIIRVMTQLKLEEFYYGNALVDWEKNKTAQAKETPAEEEPPKQEEGAPTEEETPKQEEGAPVEEETPKQEEEALAEEEPPKQEEEAPAEEEPPKREETLVAEKTLEQEEIPGLSEVVKESASYEEFLYNVATWIGFSGKREFFVNVLEAATQAEKPTWRAIMLILKNKGIKCNNTSDYASCNNQCAAKFRGIKNDVTIMKLIRVIVAYKEFDFNSEGEKNLTAEAVWTPTREESSKQEGDSVAEEVIPTEAAEEIVQKTVVRMACMPKIPWFEKKLGNMDRAQPIEEKVRYVLEAMGLKSRKPQDQQTILKIVNEAMQLNARAINSFLDKSNMSLKERITFAAFVNDFVRLHDSDPERMVQLKDFLKDLQEIVS